MKLSNMIGAFHKNSNPQKVLWASVLMDIGSNHAIISRNQFLINNLCFHLKLSIYDTSSAGNVAWSI